MMHVDDNPLESRGTAGVLPSPGRPDGGPAAVLAVLIPCHNEACSIFKVVTDFRANLPTAQIFVYDNASTDDTGPIAASAGAHVRRERLRGKGNVVRRMFADIEADIYILVDGDDTYDATASPHLVNQLVAHELDLVSAARVPVTARAFRAGHRFGNRLLTGIVAQVFGNQISDMLSGYRVMSRRFVKSFPALSSGFEIETELSVHALELRLPLMEVATSYRERGDSSSKLSTLKDGMRILRTIFRLVKDERPLSFFSLIGFAMAITSLTLGWSIVEEFLKSGQVPRLPTAVLASGLGIMSFLSFLAGLILDSVTLGRREVKRLIYLSSLKSTSGQPCSTTATTPCREFRDRP